MVIFHKNAQFVTRGKIILCNWSFLWKFSPIIYYLLLMCFFYLMLLYNKLIFFELKINLTLIFMFDICKECCGVACCVVCYVLLILCVRCVLCMVVVFVLCDIHSLSVCVVCCVVLCVVYGCCVCVVYSPSGVLLTVVRVVSVV